MFKKNILVIIALFATGSVYSIPQAPSGKMAEPTTPMQSYKQRRDDLLKMSPNGVFDERTKLFSNSFITKIKMIDVYDQTGLKWRLLLQVARDKFVPLSGKDDLDLPLLRGINDQIEKEVKAYRDMLAAI
jgi:hypothetical protein